MNKTQPALDCFVDKRAYRSIADPKPSDLVSTSELDQYDRDGFVLLRGRLSDKLVSSLLLQALPLAKLSNRSVKGLERHHDVFGQFYRSEIVRQLVAAFNGPSEMCQSYVFFKMPGELRPKPWHQDSIYWDTSAETMINLVVSLTHATKASGAVHFIPGSHKLGRLFHQVQDDGFGFPNLVCDVSAFREPVVPELAPGDVIVSHSLVVHGSFANTSPEMRINIGFHHHAVGTKISWIRR